MPRVSRFFIVAGLVWIVSLASLTWLMLDIRERTIARLGTAAGQSAWDAWRNDVSEQNQSDSSPVERRMPKSDEPPALILMRDRFAAILAGALVTWSFFFGFCAVVARGMLAKSAPSQC